jgi:hypothetical protein
MEIPIWLARCDVMFGKKNQQQQQQQQQRRVFLTSRVYAPGLPDGFFSNQKYQFG